MSKYASKWRFRINPKKTKVVCFKETPAQAQTRLNQFGDTWSCGGQQIVIAESYVYLGVTMTTVAAMILMPLSCLVTCRANWCAVNLCRFSPFNAWSPKPSFPVITPYLRY